MCSTICFHNLKVKCDGLIQNAEKMHNIIDTNLTQVKLIMGLQEKKQCGRVNKTKTEAHVNKESYGFQALLLH